ncbi:MAG: hemolysin III family protein [Actinomycetota bacterium]
MVSSAETDERPSWRGWLHASAFFVSIPAATLLVLIADSAAERASAAIYGATLMIMFGTSAAYHRLARSPIARRRMQRLDHVGIYLLIAGTYVPLAIVMLPLRWGIPLLAFVGGSAVFGAIMKLVAFDRVGRMTYVLYPVMGWAAVATAPALVEHLTSWQLFFIVAGGVVYTVGIPVLFLRRPDPWPRTFGYHEVWHAFVTVAAALHFVAVASIVA